MGTPKEQEQAAAEQDARVSSQADAVASRTEESAEDALQANHDANR